MTVVARSEEGVSAGAHEAEAVVELDLNAWPRGRNRRHYLRSTVTATPSPVSSGTRDHLFIAGDEAVTSSYLFDWNPLPV